MKRAKNINEEKKEKLNINEEANIYVSHLKLLKII